MAGSYPHVSNDNARPKIDRRTFITASAAAAIGFGANSILIANAQEKNLWTPRRNPSGPTRLDLSFQSPCNLKPGLSRIAGAGSPFPPIDPKYPDLPVQS
jgi:hypothetical protein